MPDDLDDELTGSLRAAMKTLDEQVPSGYFDALPNQILARLEDGSMQHDSGTSNIRDQRDALTGPPVPVTPVETKPARDEDSGLHDIRNLAQSTKQRLSSRRSTQNPPMSDDDVLAASSGSWKNIALPQPAKMVALPELADLPSKAEVIAADKKAEKARAKEAAKLAAVAAVAVPTAPAAPAATSVAAVDTPAAAPVTAIPERQAFTLPSQQRKSSKGPLLAIVTLGVAAAAGGVIYTQMGGSEPAAPATVAAVEQAPAVTAAAPAAAPSVEAIEAPEEPPAEPPEEPAAAEPAVVAADEADDEADKDEGKRAKRRGAKKARAEEASEKPEPKVEETKPEPAKADTKSEEGEPSFDALLKEAGVVEKKPQKPKLEKKSLTGTDFKQGMSAVNGKAKSCYKGTQGTAMVRLTIDPSGKVSKVSVSGQFAGTPEGACVEAAVKGATFPPWDGGPMTFNYSYMLAD